MRIAPLDRIGRIGLIVAFLLSLRISVQSQGSFSSGSTGADGAFNAASTQSIQVPESGVFNYTTFNIPTNVTITYIPNSKRTPVTILTTGNVSITGLIRIDGGAAKNWNYGGFGGVGGSGGFDGGLSGQPISGAYVGSNGDGPGGAVGGSSTNGTNVGGGGGGGYRVAGGAGSGQYGGAGGPLYGSSTLIPLVGGSGGGGGGSSTTNPGGGGGGGGGGAILIASSGEIAFVGYGQHISANGGSGGSGSGSGGGGGGAGGAIRLVANTIRGYGYLTVNGGSGVGSPSGGAGASGYTRIEAYNYSSFDPNLSTQPISYAVPNPAIVTGGPGLRISSVGGVASPSSPVGSLHGAPDIVLPSSQPNPVTVAIEGSQVPLGTIVDVTVTPPSGTSTTVQSTGLSGTVAASNATANVNLPAGTSVITAKATVNLQASLGPMWIDGEQVDRIEIAAVFGGPSTATYITRSGRRIAAQ